MKALVATRQDTIEIMDVPVPEPGKDEVRIRTAFCGVCATDLSVLGGTDRLDFPFILGHEWSGTVDEVGAGVDRSIIGRQCIGENALSSGGEVGFERAGGYAEYFITEAANLQFLPDGFPMDEATLAEPLAVCVRGIKRFRPTDKRSVLVFGDGPIGLLMLMLLKRAGVGLITIVGGRAPRLERARNLGADIIVNYHQASGSIADHIKSFGPAGYPNIVEASGSGSALAAMFDVAEHGAHILLIGDYDRIETPFPWQHVFHSEFEIIATNASGDAWPETAQLILSRELPLADLVTEVMPFDQARRALNALRDRQPDLVKHVLAWQ